MDETRRETKVTSASGHPIDHDEIALRVSELYKAIRLVPNNAYREQLRLLLLHIDLILWS